MRNRLAVGISTLNDKTETPNRTALTLDQATAGKTYRVLGVTGGCGVNIRLANLGIFPGQTVKVLRANRVGPVIVSAKNGKLALGRGVARQVLLTAEQDMSENAPK